MAINRYAKTNRLASTQSPEIFNETSTSATLVSPQIKVDSFPGLFLTNTSNQAYRLIGELTTTISAPYMASLSYNSDKSVMIATNWNGQPSRSLDYGATWSKLSVPGIGDWDNWQLGAYGNGRFVIVRNSTKLLKYSDDNGDTWTDVTMGPAYADWNNLVYTRGRFVLSAANDASRIVTSLDGVTWTNVSLPTVSNAYGWKITAVTPNFVILSARSVPYIIYTTDFTSFNAVNAGWNTYNPDAAYGSTIGDWRDDKRDGYSYGTIYLPVTNGYMFIQETQIHLPVNYGVTTFSGEYGNAIGEICAVRNVKIGEDHLIYVIPNNAQWIVIHYEDNTSKQIYRIWDCRTAHYVELPTSLKQDEWVSIK